MSQGLTGCPDKGRKMFFSIDRVIGVWVCGRYASFILFESGITGKINSG